MKNVLLAAFFVIMLTVSLSAQDKARVFVQGKGSENLTSSGSGGGGKHWGTWGSRSTVDSHDEGMEVTKDLQKNCSGVTVTLNQSNADYTIMLNRESKQNRGLLRSNSQVQVANRLGDVLGTSATHTVGNAAKDACQLILADWQAHGRVDAPAAASQAEPAAQETAPPAQPARLQQVAMPASTPVQAEPAQPSTVTLSSTESVGDAARHEKARKACLELAKDNPSITCK